MLIISDSEFLQGKLCQLATLQRFRNTTQQARRRGQ